MEAHGRPWKAKKPYRGAAPAVTDLLGGQVQAMFGDVPVLLPHIKAGALKPLGAAADARNWRSRGLPIRLPTTGMACSRRRRRHRP